MEDLVRIADGYVFFTVTAHVYIFRAISTVNIMKEKEAKILGK